MRRIGKAWILSAALLLLVPTYGLATHAPGHASKDFPDDQGPAVGDRKNLIAGAMGTIDFRLNLTGRDIPKVDTAQTGDTVDVPGDIPGGLPADGKAVAVAGLKAVCSSAVKRGYACGGSIFPDKVANPTDGDCNAGLAYADFSCCTATIETDHTVTLTCRAPLALGLKEWRLSRTPSNNPDHSDPNLNLAQNIEKSKHDSFEVNAITPGFNVQSFSDDTTAGNNVATDMLARFCIGVDRGNPAVDGPLAFRVRHFHGTGPVEIDSFSVNSTGLSDPALHQKIADEFEALNLGLSVLVAESARGVCTFDDAIPGHVVAIQNPTGRGGILDIQIKGLQGQRIVQETVGVSEDGTIPTLSEWGLILLVALLALSALWMLRRRRQIGSPA